jgi:hypothetical protein
MIIVIPVLVANTGLTHAALLVIRHVTTLLFTSEVEVYVTAFSPTTYAPFTFH